MRPHGTVDDVDGDDDCVEVSTCNDDDDDDDDDDDGVD
jgi:hypothetical protein